MLANQETSNVKTQNTSANLLMCFGGYSTAGLKEENQDAFAALIPEGTDLITKGGVAAMADGVSSANKAAQASQLAVTQFINEYYATPETWSTEKSAAKVLTSLNQWLYSQGSQLEQHSSSSYYSDEAPQWLTTFSALIVKSSTGYIFHVGDSRISKYRENKLQSITRDHNRKQGNKHVILTRAMGADPRLKVDVHTVDVKPGDIYVLSCDGVHDFLSTKDIEKQLSKLPESPTNTDLEAASKQLVNDAMTAGSDDNVSCLLVHIETVPNRKLAEIERDILNSIIPPALEVGMKLDEYVVKKVIHASIRSHLYLVEHTKTQKPYVLKAPSSNFADDAIYLQGFKREAWVGERINHGNIMQVKNRQSDSKFLYHICEYIEGQTLNEWIHDNPKPSIAKVREIISQVIAALRAFQRLDLVHRDLKPDNIMIDQYDQIKLIDYGTVSVASLDENQETLRETVPQGSLNYIAPETLLKMEAGHQSDLFSLGVICYEMLCGELPYSPMKRAEVTFQAYNELHYRSIKQFRGDLPIWVDLTLQKATAANPSSRYQAFSEFHADFTKPNITAVEEYKRQPLLKRNPILFWQATSFVLFTALMISLLR